MRSSFVRRVPRYPRCLMPAPRATDKPYLVRKVDVRPGRFVLMNPTTGTPDWAIPPEQLTSGDVVTPLQPTLYLGRVEDVMPDGSYFVRLWEVPSGLTGTATLSRDQIGESSLKLGDALRVYTWMEVPKREPDAFGEPQARIWVVPTTRGPALVEAEEGEP